jgi:hypothetical protein
MCDYSLEMYGSRTARAGERYVTTRFPSGSIGFSSVAGRDIAVCMQCDTRLVLSGIPEDLQVRLGIADTAIVSFAQVEGPGYRDGFTLSDGRFISLQQLRPGVHAHVVDLLEGNAANALTPRLEAAL